ncbi:MAG: MBL fold metallo-hydrolase, partial [Candidatus Diapherotrites archaeon]|nr:MBL fold metallo-hydrolase [Candidatus Diapherotrites archaeon]
GSKQTALIDSSAVGNSKHLLVFLKETKLDAGNIDLILHTHGHADHIGCDSLFPKAEIAMHEPDAGNINGDNADFACAHFFPGTVLPKVSLFLKDNQLIDLGNLQLRVIHSPGHTAGSVCFLLEKQGLLFSGDTLFAGGIGRTDLPTGNQTLLSESLRKLQKISFKALFPGHGPVLHGAKQNSENIKLMLREIGQIN